MKISSNYYRFVIFIFSRVRAFSAPYSSDVLLPTKKGRENLGLFGVFIFEV